jgi:hypothetical protein
MTSKIANLEMAPIREYAFLQIAVPAVEQNTLSMPYLVEVQTNSQDSASLKTGAKDYPQKIPSRQYFGRQHFNIVSSPSR